MNKKTAEKFKWMAQCLGQVLGDNTGFWEGYDAGREGLEWKLMSKDTVRFYRKGYHDVAFVEVSDLSPTKISNTVFHKPLTLKKELNDAYSSTASNASGAEVTRTYEISSGTETSTAIDVGASVSIGLSQSISAGGDLYGFTSETTISAEITASFNYNTSSSSHTDRTITTEITIPPKTRTTVTATRSKSKLKQDIDYTCELENSFYFFNRDHLAVQVESMADLKRFRDGDYYPGLFKDWNGAGSKGVDDMAEHRFGKYQGILGNGGNFAPVDTEYTQTIEFSNAVTGDVVITSEEIR